MSAIQPGETWRVALRYERRSVTVLEPATLLRFWKCRDLLSSAEFIVREDWFVERELPKRGRRRLPADGAP